MGVLSDWLAGQHPGLRTFKTFQEKALQLSAAEADHRALYRLLAGVAGRYVEAFDEKPVPVDVAGRAYEKFKGLVAGGEGSIGASCEKQVEALNMIAGAELF